jgi:hypothetical protein
VPPDVAPRIYRLGADPDFAWLDVADPDERARLEALSAGEPAAAWAPVTVVRADRLPGDGERPLADLAPVGLPVPVFSLRAAEALGDLLAPHGELLPLAGLPYAAFNVTTVLDALDEQRSKLIRHAGRVMQVSRFELRPERLGAPIFRLATIPRSDPFVTEAFRERVLAAGLTGVTTKPVWP